MANKFNLVEEARIAQALAPAADAAGRQSQWVDAWIAHKIWVVANIAQGNAAQVTLSFQQAQDVLGTNAKAISVAGRIWSNEDQSLTDALVAQTAGASYQTLATTKNKKVVFEIVPESMLDLVNGFKAISVSTSASNAANITQADFYLLPIRYAQAQPPSALV